MERHKLDLLSLFAGVVFVAIAVVGLLDAAVLSVADLRWLGPAALVGFGVVLVMTAGGGTGRRQTATDVSPAGEPTLTDTTSADEVGAPDATSATSARSDEGPDRTDATAPADE